MQAVNTIRALLLGLATVASRLNDCAQAAEVPGPMRCEGSGGILEVRAVAALEVHDEVTLEAWIRPGCYDLPGVRLIDKSEAGSQSGYLHVVLASESDECRFASQLPEAHCE